MLFDDLLTQSDLPDELLDAIAQEMAEHRRTVTKLREGHALMEAVLGDSTDYIVVKDRGGCYLYANPAALRAMRRSKEQVLGHDDTELLGVEQALQVMKDDRAVMVSGAPRTIEEQVAAGGGSPRTCLTTKVPYRDQSQRICGVIVVARDITKRKRLEQQLEHAARHESLCALAGGVAHDFNNLLMGMLGNVSMALNKLPPGSAVRANLENIDQAAERASELVRKMLAYSGRGKLVTQPADLTALVEENLSFLEVAVPQSVRLEPELSQEPTWIEADIAQLQQVVMSVVTNAAEAQASRPGRVRISTGLEALNEDDDRYDLLTAQGPAPGDYVFLEVSDEGPGIPKDKVERIFEPFYTTKAQGRGLGLSVAQGIVQGHGGGICVDSNPGAGATIRLVFPAAETGEARPNETPAEVGDDVETTVLVIDDEDLVLGAVAEMLTARGVTVHTADTGKAAIGLFRDRHREIGIVLLDLSMPGMSGQAVFRELRAIDPQVRVLLSSGYAEEEAARRFTEPGRCGFIQKPYRCDTLLAEIRRCLRPPGQ